MMIRYKRGKFLFSFWARSMDFKEGKLLSRSRETNFRSGFFFCGKFMGTMNSRSRNRSTCTTSVEAVI